MSGILQVLLGSLGKHGSWNPSDKSSLIVLSNSNLTCTALSSTGTGGIRSTTSKASGKWHLEATMGTINNMGFGLANAVADLTTLGQTNNAIMWNPDGDVFINATIVATVDAYTTGDTVSLEFDEDAKTLFLQKLGGTGRSASISYAALSGAVFAAFIANSGGGGSALTANFGASAFAITPTSGFGAFN